MPQDTDVDVAKEVIEAILALPEMQWVAEQMKTKFAKKEDEPYKPSFGFGVAVGLLAPLVASVTKIVTGFSKK